ncbi:MAG: SDR family NAD(P)-dependent oxidoreductase [Hyphomonadaceae bacterium]
MTRLAGKVALITGGTSGIGKTAAGLFAREGAKVVVGGRRRVEGEAVAAEICKTGGDAIFASLDVTEPESAEQAVRLAVETYGKLNVLFNNAGGSTIADRNVTEAPLEEFWRVIKVDLYGAFLCCRFAIPEIVRAGGGAVINNASLVGVQGVPGADAYTCAKGGLVALTRSMAAEFVSARVRVNGIAPAAVKTDRIFARFNNPDMEKMMAVSQPLGFIEPMEIALAALYLASDESRSITGEVLHIGGGR